MRKKEVAAAVAAVGVGVGVGGAVTRRRARVAGAGGGIVGCRDCLSERGGGVGGIWVRVSYAP